MYSHDLAMIIDEGICGGVGRIFVSVLLFPHKWKVVRMTVRTTSKEKI
jgi:hypothetical protein